MFLSQIRILKQTSLENSQLDIGELDVQIRASSFRAPAFSHPLMLILPTPARDEVWGLFVLFCFNEIVAVIGSI